MRIGSIVVRCFEFEKMLAFWRQALHYIPREPAKGGWVVLHDPAGKGPNLSLDRVLEKRSGKRSRLHLDLYTNNREGEVERLIKIGATRYHNKVCVESQIPLRQDFSRVPVNPSTSVPQGHERGKALPSYR